MRRRRSRSRIRGSASGVMLGHLVELVVMTKAGDKKAGPNTLRGLFLAWLPSKRNFAIVRKTRARSNPTPLTAKDRSVFERFHQGKPQRAVVYDSPDVVGGLRKLGKLRSLTYVTPKEIPSPQKRNTRWVHAFGDHGEEGHGPSDGRIKGYPSHLMPTLCRDKRGNFFIKRDHGNKYDVTEWIYW